MTIKIEHRAVSKLVPYARNSRTHSDAQVAQIAASIREFGWTNPILVDGSGGIIAGHGRLLAARQLGMDKVPCISLEHLSETQRRALVIADNKLALNAGWDSEMLALEIGELAATDFDMALLGFNDAELTSLSATPTSGLTDPDDIPEAPAEPVSVLGDAWVLGRHRVLCGSSTSPDDLDKALGGLSPDIVCSDPPYGISVVKGSSIGGAKPFGNVHGRGKSGFGKVHGAARNAIIAPGVYAPIIGDETTETAVEHYALVAAMNVPVIVLWGGNYFADAPSHPKAGGPRRMGH